MHQLHQDRIEQVKKIKDFLVGFGFSVKISNGTFEKNVLEINYDTLYHVWFNSDEADCYNNTFELIVSEFPNIPYTISAYISNDFCIEIL